MALLDYPVFSGTSAYNSIDTYVSTLPNGGGLVQPGIAAKMPITPALANVKGQGAPLVLRYVRYNSTANPAIGAAPGPVYWTDETLTTVSGVSTESVGGVNMISGCLLINTTNYPGSLTGAQLATALNGNYCWIAVSGYVAGVTCPNSVVAGDTLIGAATNFTLARIAAGSQLTNTLFARALSTVSANVADMLIGGFDWEF
jgi:hypothetical protein